MSNPAEATNQERQLSVVKPTLPTFNLTPKTLAEAMELAKLMSDSELVPKDFRGKPGNVLIAVQMGAEVGLSPMQAIQSIAIVNGRPAIWGDAPLALVRASGLLEEIVEEWDPSTSVATCTVRRRGEAVPIVRTFGLEDARRVEIISYDNGNRKTSKLAEKDTYKNYPSRMCQMRARAFALRDGFGDVLKGLAVKEEIEDHPGEPRNITPESERPATPPRKSERLVLQPQAVETKAETTSAPATEEKQVADDPPAAEPKGRGGDPDFKIVTKIMKLLPQYNRKHGDGAGAKLLEQTYEVAQASKLSAAEAAEFLATLEKDLGRTAS
jgi:hypothetical protein